MAATAEPIEFTALNETYSLKMGFAAVCKMELVYDKGFFEIAQTTFGSQMRMGDLLTIFHACMFREDSGGRLIEDVTRDETAAIIDDLGMEKASALIRQAIQECPLFYGPVEEKPKVRGAGAAKKRAAAAQD